MKNITIVAAIFSCATLANDDVNSITNDTVQQNDATVSPTSVMSNTQVNSGTTFDSYGGGVTCARATFNIGTVGTVGGNSGYNTGTQIYAGVNIPLFSGKSCEDAAKAQLYIKRQQRLTMQEVMRRDNELHKANMKKKDLQYADLLAKVCMNFHDKIVAKNDSTLTKECIQYRTISHGNPKYDEGDYSRIADH